MIDALQPFVERGVPIVGLEPSCLLTLRDEYISLIPGASSKALAENAFLFEEFLAREQAAGRLQLDLKPIASKRALLHGHCHQKAFAAMSAVEQVLALIPDLEVETIDSSCCGMAGSFGYEAEHYDISMQMGSLSLFPAIQAAGDEALIIADGTSCRSQIEHGTGRQALHVARVLQMAL
jgi:Fe-S oxidoreductase